MTPTGKQCSAKVWGTWHYHICTKPAIVERNGEWYCKIHDPEYIKARDERKDAEQKATMCTKCGSNPRGDWKYCPYCGTKYPPHKMK